MIIFSCFEAFIVKGFVVLEKQWTMSLIIVSSILAATWAVAKIRKVIQQLSTPKAVRSARVWAVFANILVLTALTVIAIDTWNYLEGPKWNSLINVGILIVFLSEAYNLVKINKMLSKPTAKIMAEYFARLSLQHFEKRSDDEAISAIKAACDLDPQEPIHWLRFSSIEKDIRKAEEYIQIAENIVKKRGLKSREIAAWIEFFKGGLCLADPGNIELALEHFNNSLKINYNKKVAEHIQKVISFKNSSIGSGQ